MERTPVKSSNVASVGFDKETGTLEIEYKSGGVYHYVGVDADKHSDLMKAPSIGAFVHAHIKGKHAHSKLDK